MRSPTAFLMLALLSGCLATTSPTQRIALATNPGAPPSLRGAAGIGLAARAAMAAPTPGASGNGLAVPAVQPELNGVFKFGEHFYGSFDFVFAFGDLARPARSDAPRVTSTASLGGMLGFGADLPISDSVGLSGAVEGGMSEISVSSSAGGVPLGDQFHTLPIARASIAPYFDRGPVRVFVAGTIGTDVWSDASAVATTCVGCAGFNDTGRTLTTAVGMFGGGVRYRPTPQFAAALELWVPVTTSGVHHGPQLSLAVQIGDLDFSRSKRAVEPEPEPELPLSPPPPPPPPPPAPVESPTVPI